jgi:hypothetical protein
VKLVENAETFRQLTGSLSRARASFVLAEINDLLTESTSDEVAALPHPGIEDRYLANYVAAMVECAAHRTGILPPPWTARVPPLDEPVFAVPWLSLRAHLLLNSPPPFRRRNIFIDSTLGSRV